MKTFFTLLFVLFTISFNAQTRTYYTCPMHPEIVRNAPGDCPKCGMTLVKKTVALKKPAPKPTATPKPKAVEKSKPAPAKTVQPKKTVTKKAAPVQKKTVEKKPVNTVSKPKIPVKKTESVQPKKAVAPKTETNKNLEEVSHQNHSEATTYTCPMHPQIISDKPGKCPICGMNLVAKEDENQNHHAESTAHKQIIPVPKYEIRNGKKVRYDLYVKDTIVDFAGKKKRAIAVNGKIPMPTLEFYEGDTAEIVVHNMLKEETSLHWHGLHLPNKEDGVPWLTQKPIPPNSTYTYKFPVIQNGTHWYHSHSGLQEQIGMYGSLILKKREEDPAFRKGIDDLPTVPIILSEWTNLNPNNVQRMLHNANDWFAIKKHSTQSYSEAIKEGHFKTKLENEWKRMLAMDVSDIYYDKFLINGKSEHQLSQFKAGDEVRLRISNGGASSYFWLNYSGGKIKVVASDGLDIEPLEVDRLIIAVSETYDIVLKIPENKSYELLATAEDRTKSASLFLGNGQKVHQTPLPKLNYFEGMKMMNSMMDMNGNMKDMGMKMSYQTMDMNEVMYPELDTQSMDHSKMNMNGSEMKMDHSKMDHSKMNHSDMQMKDSEMKMDHSKMQASDKTMDHSKMDHSDHQMKSDSMKMDSEMDHSGHEKSDSGIKTLNYGMMKSPYDTSLPKNQPVKELKFTLTGNMNRYVWSMDDKVLSESDKILVKKGEILRITLYNNSMMRHPMHLHGFDFRVLNKNGIQAPLKNVLDIMPMEEDVIEFAANTDGDWFFHCHILYHMMAGMNRVFAVGDTQNPELPNKNAAYKKLQRESNMWHLMAENDFATNGNDGMAMLSNTRWELSSEWRLGYNAHHGYEVETQIGRYVDRMQWFKPFIGYTYHYRKMDGGHEKNLFGQKNLKDERSAFSAGFVYTLPMLVDLQAEVFHDGIFRVQLGREDIPLTPRLRGAFMVNTDKEYMAGLKYILTRNLGVSTHYDSDMGIGFGVTLNY